MMQKKAKNVTFVIYENQKPAKCFEFKKSYLRFLFFATPSLLILGPLFLSFFLIYIKNVESIRGTDSPALLTLKNENVALNTKIKELEKAQASFFDKLNASSGQSEKNVQIKAASPLSQLYSFVQLRNDVKDMTTANIITISNERFQKNSGQVVLTFNLQTTAALQKKIAGHILVLLKGGSFMSLYPATSERPPYHFTQGESFTVGRFRPVEASFTPPAHFKGPLFFDILIFAKNGDILIRKTVGPFSS